MLSAYVIVESAQVYLSIISMQQISRMVGMGLIQLKCQYLFYCTSIIYGIARISSSACFCFAEEYHFIPWNAVNISYSAHLIAMVLILYLRLHSVFNHTSYRLNNSTVCAI